MNDLDNEVPICFICDHPSCGAYFDIPNCRTESNKTRISKKLSDLVGTHFLIMTEEHDVICRSCFNIVNTMEKLELQLQKLGNTILDFLEEKYSLPHGEIFEHVPPLEIKFCKESSKSDEIKGSRESKVLKDNTEIEETDSPSIESKKLLHCNQCKYNTPFRAYMVFHLREHRRLSCAPEGEKKKPTRNNRKCKTGVVSRRMRPPEVEELVTPTEAPQPEFVEEIIDTGGEGVYSFMPMEEDHLSDEMLNKVDALVEASEEISAVLLPDQHNVQISETTSETQLPDPEDQLQVLLADNDLLEVVGQPGVFCMVDSNTGKITQRFRQLSDGSYVPLDVLEEESQTVMHHQLEDGTFELVCLTGLEDPQDLTLL